MTALLRRLRTWLGGEKVHTAVRPKRTTQIAPPEWALDIPADDGLGEDGVAKYPPSDRGIPLRPVTHLVANQRELLERLFRTAGVSRPDFEKLYLPPIRNLAGQIHLLPATPTSYYRGTGGLFRMCLEIGVHSLQAANSAVFPIPGGVEKRFHMQPMWSLATFLAGLCSQNFKSLNQMVVLTRDHRQWKPYLESLVGWAQSQGAEEYFVRWVDGDISRGSQASSAYIVSRVIPPEILDYLSQDNHQIIPAMTAAIAGFDGNASDNVISRLVSPVVTRVIEADLRHAAINYGHLIIGAHLEPHLIDAMRRCVRSGKWAPNNAAGGGAVWVGTEGVFLDWSQCADDIVNLLRSDGYAGLPADPDTLADLLLSAGVLEKGPDGQVFWSISLPSMFEMRDGMVKLTEREMIFRKGVVDTLGEGINLLPKKRRRSAAPKQQESETMQLPLEPDEQAVVEEVPKSSRAESQAKAAPAKMPDVSSDDSRSVAPKLEDQTPVEPGGRNSEAKAKRRKPTSAKPEAAEARDVIASAAATPSAELQSSVEDLLQVLQPETAKILRDIGERLRTGSLVGTVCEVEHGIGICTEELKDHGASIPEIVRDLGERNWLWTDVKKPSRRVHQIDLPGDRKARMLVLRKDIGTAIGLGAAKVSEMPDAA